jgi:CO/xanthine dehydrogenase FAD-binding subunit
MPTVTAYHRPTNLDEAVHLLGEPRRRVIAGGTVVVAEVRTGTEAVELVDLQALGIGGVRTIGDRLQLGSMATLGELVRRSETPDLIRELCTMELPSALRNQATIGGTVALADSESVLCAGLLVHDAVVEFHDGDATPLSECLLDGVGARLVTGVTIDPAGAGAIAATARTPRDVPIVAAVARRVRDTVRLAITGVAACPVEVDPDDPSAGLDPPEDFRGSAEYRLHLAEILAARVVRSVR